MAVVYSMKTVHSLLGRIAKSNSPLQSQGGSLPITSTGGGLMIILPWSDAATWENLPLKRRRIWQSALSHPHGRYNYLGLEPEEIRKQLAAQYDVESLNLFELVQLGQHAVENGLLSVAEYSTLVTTSRIEEKFDVFTGTPMLMERNAQIKFNLLDLWKKRLKILSKIKNPEFESTEDIIRFLHSLCQTRDQLNGL